MKERRRRVGGSQLSQKKADEILKHKPDPEKKSLRQLAKYYGVTTSVIRGIWNRGGLPDKKLATRKLEEDLGKNDIEEMRRLMEKTRLSDYEIAEKMGVVKRIVVKIRNRLEREQREEKELRHR